MRPATAIIIDKYLKPTRFDCDPNETGSDKKFKHWLKTFTNFITSINTTVPPSASSADSETTTQTSAQTVDTKLNALINYISADVFEYIADCDEYDQAIKTLTDIYVKPVNKIYARYKLATRKQTEGESIDSFIQDLHRLSKECSFEAVTGEENRQGYVRDAFISGIRSKEIRQKLLENGSLMNQAFGQARTLQAAYRNAEAYNKSNTFSACASTYEQQFEEKHEDVPSHLETVAATSNLQTDQTCWFCGNAGHSRNQCPAKGHKCKLCSKYNHWERVCRNSRRNVSWNGQQQGYHNTPQTKLQQQQQPSQSAAIWPTLATTSTAMPSTTSTAMPSSVARDGKTTAFCNIKIKNRTTRALIDSGSLSWSFIDQTFAERLQLITIPTVDAPQVSMANSSLTTKVEGECYVDILLQNRKYTNVKLYVLANLCSDVILGQDFMKQHKSVVFNFGGDKPSLIVSTIGTVSTLTAMKIPSPKLFEHLTDDCRPIAVRSRKQTPANAKFIHEEVQKLLADGIIVPSTSPWRAQVLVTKENQTHKRRMVVDYKQTINRFTKLDAYPLPDTEDINL